MITRSNAVDHYVEGISDGSKAHRSTLKLRPVDRLASIVTRKSTDVFEPPTREGGVRKTYVSPTRPRGERMASRPDYTGLRRGRFVAFQFVRHGYNRKRGDVWSCRCDCGNFENHRPKTWAKKDDRYVEFMCAICTDRENAVKQRQGLDKSERVKRFIYDLVERGLSKEEVLAVQLSKGRVHTHGLKLSSIRLQMVQCAICDPGYSLPRETLHELRRSYGGG